MSLDRTVIDQSLRELARFFSRRGQMEEVDKIREYLTVNHARRELNSVAGSTLFLYDKLRAFEPNRELREKICSRLRDLKDVQYVYLVYKLSPQTGDEIPFVVVFPKPGLAESSQYSIKVRDQVIQALSGVCPSGSRFIAPSQDRTRWRKHLDKLGARVYELEKGRQKSRAA